MTIASRLMSLRDFLEHDDGTDTRYELENGVLLDMPPESDRNQRIASFLFAYFLQLGIPFYRLRIGAELVVSGPGSTVRLPDLIVLSEELAIALQGATRSTVILEMPPPTLVVEVVSPGKKNQDRDYRYKRSQYEARGVAEYWIVDPEAGKVTILVWVNGLYEARSFGDGERLVSETFEDLDLTVEAILQAGMSL